MRKSILFSPLPVLSVLIFHDRPCQSNPEIQWNARDGGLLFVLCSSSWSWWIQVLCASFTVVFLLHISTSCRSCGSCLLAGEGFCKAKIRTLMGAGDVMLNCKLSADQNFITSLDFYLQMPS